MSFFKKSLIIIALIIFNSPILLAATNIKPEITPPPPEGPLPIQDLGPSYTRPLPPTQTTPATPQFPQSQAESSPQQQKEPSALFGDEKTLTPREEKNPLEEEDKKEWQALNDPESTNQNATPPQNPFIQSQEDQSMNIPDRARKEIDLNNTNPNS